MTVFAPSAVRASEAARCYRQAAYRALGAPEADKPREVNEYLARGRVFEDYVVAQLERKHGKENVRRQVPIDWGMGEPGHADALIVPARLLVEVVSTVSPSPSGTLWQMKLNQLRLYLRHCDDADTGALMVINPSTLAPVDVYKVVLTPEDIAAIDEATAGLRAAIDGGDLPPRVCTRPGQARGRLCPFAETCFEGWEPPDPSSVADPVALNAVTRLASVKNQERDNKTSLRALEAARKEIQAELNELLPVGDSIVGPYAVRRLHKVRRPTFNEKVAEAAGFPVASIAEFYTGGSEWDEYTVKPAETPGEVDYDEGGVPF